MALDRGNMSAACAQKTVCLVLDNPERDLFGLALLAVQLALRGVRVLLVPMYDQQQHVTKARPDYVVLNYARKANAAAMRLYRGLGIRTAVLDTEGGVLRCEYRELLNIVRDAGVKELIDDYFLWGPRQYAAFQKDLGSPSTSLYLTGCPRFDLYHQNWRSLVPDPPFGRRPYVLIATSFPLNNPRFATAQQEITNLMETMGLEREALEEAQAAADRALAGFVEWTAWLCRALPSVDFVLRPHPFENEAAYAALAGIPNLTMARGGVVASWLKECAAVVQLNSSVAFEAALWRTPVISLEAFQHPLLEVAVASRCSLAVTTKEHLRSLVETLLGSSPDPEIRKQLEAARQAADETVAEWIYRNDGRSSIRVAEQIMKALAPLSPPPRKDLKWLYRFSYVFLYYLAKLWLKRVWGRTAHKSRTSKQFEAKDLSSVAALFREQGIRLADRPLGPIWPFRGSNAVEISMQGPEPRRQH
jgi:surface carbohydrate biosynthesis protein